MNYTKEELKIATMDAILKCVEEHKEDDYYEYTTGMNYLNELLNIVESYYIILETEILNKKEN